MPGGKDWCRDHVCYDTCYYLDEDMRKAVEEASLRSLTHDEVLLLAKYCPGWAKVRRMSERAFDLNVEGMHFLSWLPLAVIYAHPDWWFGDDWSVTRDAPVGDIWATFDTLFDKEIRNA